MSITFPETIQLPQESPLNALLGGIGGGIQAGSAETLRNLLLQRRITQNLLQKMLMKKQQPLTPYQELLTTQRQKDLQRKIGGYIGNLLKSETKFGQISPFEKAKIDKTTYEKVQQGLDLPTAATESIGDYMNRKEFLDSINIPSPSIIAKQATKNKLIKTLKEYEITDPFEIQKLMTDKKWKGKDIQDVYKVLRAPTKITEKSMAPIEKETVTSTQKTLTQEEIMQRYNKVPGKTREQKLKNLKKILEQEGYTVTGL